MMLSQVLLPMFYFVPLAFLLSQDLRAGEVTRGGLGMVSGTFVFLSYILSSALAWLTISAEDAPDLMAGAPVPRREIEMAKVFAACAPVCVLLLIPSVLGMFVAPMAGLWLFPRRRGGEHLLGVGRHLAPDAGQSQKFPPPHWHIALRDDRANLFDVLLGGGDGAFRGWVAALGFAAGDHRGWGFACAA